MLPEAYLKTKIFNEKFKLNICILFKDNIVFRPEFKVYKCTSTSVPGDFFYLSIIVERFTMYNLVTYFIHVTKPSAQIQAFFCIFFLYIDELK